ncbi:histidine phosphatase family protein [Cellulomonas soli]
MPLTLTLVRHGRTVYNTEHLLQGWCDSPLTPSGLDGVRVTAAHLADRPFVAAYASPLGRTVATAGEILAHHPDVTLVTDPDLREYSFGDLEATPEADLWSTVDPFEMFPAVLAGTFPGLPGGEDSPGYLRRVRSAFDRIEQAHPHGDVLVVSHGVTLLAYLTMIDPGPVTPLANASVSTVHVHPDGSREVVAIGLDIAGQGVPDAPSAAAAEG